MNWGLRLRGRDGKLPRSFRRRHTVLADLVDDESGWYRRWYFMARLGDELAAAAREERRLTVVLARLPLGGWEPESRLRVHLSVRLALIEREARGANACFGRLSEDEFVVFVPDSHRLSGDAAGRTIERRLAGLAAETAIVSFPEDGADTGSLIEAARDRLDGPPHNVIDLELFRQRRREAA